MKLKVRDFQDVCNKLSMALDANKIDIITNVVELQSDKEASTLQLSLTNHEYYVAATVETIDKMDFSATVAADIFFKLIHQLSTDTVELVIDSNTVVILSNGTYKMPIIYEDDEMLKIVPLAIDNVESTFDIHKVNMLDVMIYNSKEISKSLVKQPVQQMYYFDNEGCITFTSGACVNNFTIDTNQPFLLSSKVVNLFKLFKDDTVTWTIGSCSVSGIQTQVLNLSDSVFNITARIVCDDTLVHKVPKNTIKQLMSEVYPYTVVLNRIDFLNAIDRLLIFMPQGMDTSTCGIFKFTNSTLTLCDIVGSNTEKIFCDESSALPDDGTDVMFDFMDIKSILDTNKNEKVSFKFGTGISAVVQYSHITNIIPECIK